MTVSREIHLTAIGGVGMTALAGLLCSLGYRVRGSDLEVYPPASDELARLVERFDREGKIVAAVCHGPAGLVSAKKADGTPLVAGRRVAGFTDSEERAVGLDQAVPFLLETRLKELGGKHEGGPDFAPFALRDGNLVTGQNPASATLTAELVMEALKDKVA